jgi:thiamine-phosphate pyrophosphorylase
LAAGVDMVQVRERDLPAREILSISEAAVQIARTTGARVLVNDRADIATCVGAGVHLTTRSVTANVVRHAFGKEMLVGASTHNLEEAVTAESGGADFVVFGPVFETASKREYGPPAGIEALRAIAKRLSIPVLALGGITLANAPLALDAGAAGIAAISLFAKSDDLEAAVRTVKRIKE